MRLGTLRAGASLKSSIGASLRVSILALALQGTAGAETTLLNASYDVTREFYQAYNEAFAAHWKAKTGEAITVNQAHTGSSKQARAVLDGLEADVVTMNQSTDIEILTERNLVSAEWRKLFPDNAAPYTSTILFLVRKGNPKGIKDWSDLVRNDVEVIIPNPKLSGNGRYSYIAAWGYALKQSGGDETKAREFVKKFLANVPVLDSGGRAATMTFAHRNIGDVLLTFENEIRGTLKELGDKFEVVVPSVSILAESPVAVVEPVADKHGTRKLAESYLNYLYSEKGQEIIAAHYFRPRSENVLKAHSDVFPDLNLFTIEEVAGGWKAALKVHFSEGGVFDQLYTKK